MNPLEPRALLRRQATPPLDPQLVALRGACMGAAGVSVVWLSIGLSAAWKTLLTLGPVGLLIALLTPFVATVAAVLYAHALNGPTAVRVVPREWITALGSIGPITVGLLVGLLVTWPAQIPWQIGLTMALGGGAGMVLAPFGVGPLVNLWMRRYRSDDTAAVTVTVVSAGLALGHLALLLALLL